MSYKTISLPYSKAPVPGFPLACGRVDTQSPNFKCPRADNNFHFTPHSFGCLIVVGVDGVHAASAHPVLICRLVVEMGGSMDEKLHYYTYKWFQ
jgi:hypothetical protein